MNGDLMNIEDIKILANNFWGKAIEINSYYSILKQYSENYNKYYDEMCCSSAFYSITYQALQVAMFIELAKLYDRSKNAINIRFLLEECIQNIENFPKYRAIIEIDGEKQTKSIPYYHQIKQEEECYFKEYIKKEREWQELFETNGENMPIIKDLSIYEYFDMYKKRYHALKPQIENLSVQRNKIYAHNDKELCFNIDEILMENPISFGDIQELIDYALDVSRFVIGCLENVCKQKQYENIDDWEMTLRLVRLGNKNRDVDVES